MFLSVYPSRSRSTLVGAAPWYVSCFPTRATLVPSRHRLRKLERSVARMPLYDYRCTACGTTFEVSRQVGKAGEECCPDCGGGSEARLHSRGRPLQGQRLPQHRLPAQACREHVGLRRGVRGLLGVRQLSGEELSAALDALARRFAAGIVDATEEGPADAGPSCVPSLGGAGTRKSVCEAGHDPGRLATSASRGGPRTSSRARGAPCR